ncbi:hypothetical protein acsn021_26180 [Anaerocolumna cellulosilytica]|uniref:Uncharacterized protein n=1 Tax=Anaerocolumna cellulosilytica TaxID=433286 RepID=A0A6S6R140_9FIRM|nr:hypothetical protein [Anaerocolumna cellulosilytica]MBB5193734.1 hypothetical protein [Anaerocolumna cellulosilytica]BCJ95049.1 hypothetical protein acsn021_26180 [Anaerocolumna cellulosilytica]
MDNFTGEYNNIGIQYEDRVVRIKADQALYQFLLEPSCGSYLLAKHILKEYRRRFHKPLQISVHSLAIEIIAHVFVDKLSVKVSGFLDKVKTDLRKPVIAAVNSIHRHTEIIDCGEEAIDNNRFIWDSLEPFHAMIYALAGDAS